MNRLPATLADALTSKEVAQAVAAYVLPPCSSARRRPLYRGRLMRRACPPGARQSPTTEPQKQSLCLIRLAILRDHGEHTHRSGGPRTGTDAMPPPCARAVPWHPRTATAPYGERRRRLLPRRKDSPTPLCSRSATRWPRSSTTNDHQRRTSAEQQPGHSGIRRPASVEQPEGGRHERPRADALLRPKSRAEGRQQRAKGDVWCGAAFYEADPPPPLSSAAPVSPADGSQRVKACTRLSSPWGFGP